MKLIILIASLLLIACNRNSIITLEKYPGKQTDVWNIREGNCLSLWKGGYLKTDKAVKDCETYYTKGPKFKIGQTVKIDSKIFDKATCSFMINGNVNYSWQDNQGLYNVLVNCGGIEYKEQYLEDEINGT